MDSTTLIPWNSKNPENPRILRGIHGIHGVHGSHGILGIIGIIFDYIRRHLLIFWRYPNDIRRLEVPNEARRYQNDADDSSTISDDIRRTRTISDYVQLYPDDAQRYLNDIDAIVLCVLALGAHGSQKVCLVVARCDIENKIRFLVCCVRMCNRTNQTHHFQDSIFYKNMCAWVAAEMSLMDPNCLQDRKHHKHFLWIVPQLCVSCWQRSSVSPKHNIRLMPKGSASPMAVCCFQITSLHFWNAHKLSVSFWRRLLRLYV